MKYIYKMLGLVLFVIQFAGICDINGMGGADEQIPVEYDWDDLDRAFYDSKKDELLGWPESDELPVTKAPADLDEPQAELNLELKFTPEKNPALYHEFLAQAFLMQDQDLEPKTIDEILSDSALTIEIRNKMRKIEEITKMSDDLVLAKQIVQDKMKANPGAKLDDWDRVALAGKISWELNFL